MSKRADITATSPDTYVERSERKSNKCGVGIINSPFNKRVAHVKSDALNQDMSNESKVSTPYCH